MSVNINKVYQKVLALANKEQRGYITPQEFNLFADHAQQDIFEQYFYDLEQRQRGIGSESSYEIISNIEEKIAVFEQYNYGVTAVGASNEYWISSEINNIYRLGDVRVIYNDPSSQDNILAVQASKTRLNELSKYLNSPLTAPTKKNPIYVRYSISNSPIRIRVYPSPMGGSVKVDYIRKPSTPNWTYVISSTGNALFDQNATTSHFDLHWSEETNLVVKILQLAGVAIKDFNLVQAAAQDEVKSIQLEKQ